MRICDKKGCDERQLKTMTTAEGQEFDLCNTHMNEFLEWVNKKPKPRGRPRNKIFTGNSVLKAIGKGLDN